jgi:predicted lipoprotein with Yx(FWY)xxD motif
MRAVKMAGTALALGILAAACGSGGSDGSTSSATPAAVSSSPPGGSAVDARKAGLGTILVDGKGMTLYLFEKDKGGKSSCDGACASAWPPVLTTGKAMPGPGVTASLLGTTTRSDGTTQVTYNHWPLYHYAADKVPGDTTGQDIDAFGAEWYVLDAAKGTKLEK